MAYTTINKPADYFNTITYTGDGTAIGSGGNAITGVGFQPDFVWIKARSQAYNHHVYDITRGVQQRLITNGTFAEATLSESLESFDTDGFTLGDQAAHNESGVTYASWNWLGAGTAPSKTYAVTVVSDSGNKYRFDGYGTSAVTLEISEGGTYRFDQSDSSNSGHPLRFSTTSDGTHGGGSEYTTGVTTVGTPGTSGAYTEITVAASAPTLYYYCSVHSGMGGQANTPTTNSFSNFDGGVQSNISPNTTSGFSIVTWTGTGADATVGHGLSSAPELVIVKNRTDSATDWRIGNSVVSTRTFADGNGYYLEFDTGAISNPGSETIWGSPPANPTTSVFKVGSNNSNNGSGDNMIAYCFHSVKGFSKFGSYTGNGNADGTFVYTGFKPAWVIVKRTDSTGSWFILDNKRNIENVMDKHLLANTNDAEVALDQLDFLSNGFKWRLSSSARNGSGNSYIYMAFAENPFVSSTGTPVTAR